VRRPARVVAVAGLLAACAECAGGAAAQAVRDADGGRPARGLAAEEAVRRIIAGQFVRYPRMEPQDVYKLVFQAAMGSRHAGLDSAMAAAWLEREIASLAVGPEEPVLDTISADGRMVRVNLRPYFSAGGSRGALLSAFVRTAREYRGSTSELRRGLADVERMAAAGLIPLPHVGLHAYFARMRARGYPAVEHSAAYEAAYHPAYRVVLLPFLQRAPGEAAP